MVLSKSFEEYSACPIQSGRRQVFDVSRSFTYRDRGALDPHGDSLTAFYENNGTCIVPFGFYKWRAHYATDDTGLGTTFTRYKNAPFVIADSVNARLDPHWASDGVLGLGGYTVNNVNSTDPRFSTVHWLALQQGRPVVTLYVGRDAGSIGGLLTFGADDAQNCQSDWKYLANYTGDAFFVNENWNFRFTRFRYGSVDLNVTADMSDAQIQLYFSGTYTYIYQSYFRDFLNETGVTYDKATTSHVIDCSKAAQMPELVFSTVAMDGSTYDYRIPAKDYVRNLTPRSDSKCTVLLAPTDGQGLNIYAMFGMSAARSHCWQLDYERSVVGVSSVVKA
ncbi:Protein ASP-7 [Aphelenchoides avenae]|nr:Protein ASP-7 [Aphelenchus avenae]